MKKSVITIISVLAVCSARAADITATFRFNPSLSNEGNALFKLFNLSGEDLLLVNAAITLTLVIVPLLYYWWGASKKLNAPSASTWDFAAICLYNRSMSKTAFLSKLLLSPDGWFFSGQNDRKQQFRFLGFILVWGVTFASYATALSWWVFYSWKWSWYISLRQALTFKGIPGFEIGVAIIGLILAAIFFFVTERDAANKMVEATFDTPRSDA